MSINSMKDEQEHNHTTGYNTALKISDLWQRSHSLNCVPQNFVS